VEIFTTVIVFHILAKSRPTSFAGLRRLLGLWISCM